MPSKDVAGSFKTHAGYIHALAYLCGYSMFARDPEVITALAARIRAEPSYTALTPRTGFDRDQLRRSLDAAWGSELLLAVTGAYAPDELRGVSNTWVAIQASYACYHAIQALLIAKGQLRPTSHPKTQKMFVDTWVSPPRNWLPWSLGASHGFYNNLPAAHTVDEHIHPWTTLDAQSAVDVACKALRTTREDFIVEESRRERHKKQTARKKAWELEEADRLARGRKARKKPSVPLPRLAPTEKTAIRSRTRAYGMLDYLYRLRIKAQYEDATLFSDGPEDAIESVLVYRQLDQIVRSTLLLHEIFIERIAGRAIFEPLVDAWNRRQATTPVKPLLARRPLILP